MGIEYNRSGDKVEIIIRDVNGGKIESHHCQVGDRKKYASILRYLKDKYGFEPEVDGINGTKDLKVNEGVDWWE